MSKDTEYKAMLKALVEMALISFTAPDKTATNNGQWGSADINAGSFYFKISNREKIAAYLKPCKYDTIFLELKCHTENMHERVVPFYYDMGTIPLKDFTTPEDYLKNK